MEPDALTISNQFLGLGHNVGQVLWYECISVAKVLIPALLVFRVMMGGFGIIQGTTTPPALIADLVIRGGLLVILVSSPVVQPVLVKSLSQCESVGMKLSEQILALTPSGADGRYSGSKAHPLSFWPDWIRTPTNKKLDPEQYRLSFHNVLVAVWDYEPPSLSRLIDDIRGGEGTGNFIMDFINSITNLATSFFVSLGYVLLPLLFIFATFLTLIMVIAIFLGIVIVVLFSFLAGYIGPILLFYVTMSLGVLVLPLILFDRFKDMWAEYLSFLLSCCVALIFFYLFSAIGFYLSDAFVRFVVEGEQGQRGFFAQFLFSSANAENFSELVNNLVNKLAPNIVSSLSIVFAAATSIVEPILRVTLALGMWFAGATILTSIMALGIGMGGVGATLGFMWARAFTSDNILSYLNQRITGLGQLFQSTVASQLSQGAGQFGGAIRGLPSLGRGLAPFLRGGFFRGGR